MKDFIPKGTGNSRWMKSSIPTGTTWEEALAMLRAGTFPFDLNGTNSSGIAQQGTALNKANLLSDAALALFGLGSDAVPNDVLRWIGKHNQHWWKRRKSLGKYVPVLDLQSQSPDSVNDNNYIFCARARGSQTFIEGTVRYADELNISATGEILGLKEPIKSFIVSYENYKNAEILKNKYVLMKYVYPSSSIDEERGILYVGSDSGIYRTNDGSQLAFVYASPAAINITTKVVPGDWEYVQSSDRDAYPDSGAQGEYEYQYLGIPFENAVTSPKIATGSYTGTGTYGESNPSSITVDFTPRLLFVAQIYAPNYGANGIIATPLFEDEIEYFGRGNNKDFYGRASRGGNTAKWYGTWFTGGSTSDFPKAQLNQNGYTYLWLIAGN